MNQAPSLTELDQRSREIFRQIVQAYIETGDPSGSRNISRSLPMTLSPASVRNVMADLEALGLIYAPHTSAGRLPTETGLRLFVDGMMEVGDLAPDERQKIEKQVAGDTATTSIESLLNEASQLLSGLSLGAGVVLANKADSPVQHIEFVRIDPTRALVVLVGDGGKVENRIIDLPPGLPTSALTEASNYLNAHLNGGTLSQLRAAIEKLRADRKSELDALTEKIVDAGLAVWAGGDDVDAPKLIVRGRSNLLSEASAQDDLERIRMLFDDLETKDALVRLLSASEDADGVRIFIGSENKLFSLSGSSLIVSPYRDGGKQIVGVLGVIGPTRLNYARIIPMVDYTAKLVGELLAQSRLAPSDLQT